MLESERDVVRALIRYCDWWQPSTSSVIDLPKRRNRRSGSDGLHPGLIESLDERTELRARASAVPEGDRQILFLWYVKQLHVDDIALETGVSRRQCFRRRARAVRRIVDLGDTDRAE